MLIYYQALALISQVWWKKLVSSNLLYDFLNFQCTLRILFLAMIFMGFCVSFLKFPWDRKSLAHQALHFRDNF